MGEVVLHHRERLVEVDLDALGELDDQRLGLVERALEVAALLAQELDVLREAGAFGLGQWVHRTDAVAAALEPFEPAPQRGRVVVVAGGSKKLDLEGRRDLLETGRDLERGAPRGGRPPPGRPPARSPRLVDLVAQRHLLFGQATGVAALAHAALGLTSLVAEARDERLDTGLQRRQRHRHLVAGRGGRRHAREALLDLDAGAPGRSRPRGAARGRARRRARCARARRSSSSMRAAVRAAERLVVARFALCGGRPRPRRARSRAAVRRSSSSADRSASRPARRRGRPTSPAAAAAASPVARCARPPCGARRRRRPRGGAPASSAVRGRLEHSRGAPRGPPRQRRRPPPRPRPAPVSRASLAERVAPLRRAPRSRAALHHERARHARGEAELAGRGPVVGAVSRHRESREGVGHGGEIVDHHDVGDETAQASPSPLITFGQGPRPGKSGRRRHPGARHEQTGEAHAGRAQSLEQRPLVRAPGHGQRTGMLRQRRAERELVAALAAERRRELDHAGVALGHAEHRAVDLAQLRKRRPGVVELGVTPASSPARLRRAVAGARGRVLPPRRLPRPPPRARLGHGQRRGGRLARRVRVALARGEVPPVAAPARRRRPRDARARRASSHGAARRARAAPLSCRARRSSAPPPARARRAPAAPPPAPPHSRPAPPARLEGASYSKRHVDGSDSAPASVAASSATRLARSSSALRRSSPRSVPRCSIRLRHPASRSPR